MKEEAKAKLSVIFSVVIATMLTTAISLLAWTANVVIAQGQILAVHTNAFVDLGKRIDKLETAALLNATMPGKLEAIAVRQDAMSKGQDRIEEMLGRHMINEKSNKP